MQGIIMVRFILKEEAAQAESKWIKRQTGSKHKVNSKSEAHK